MNVESVAEKFSWTPLSTFLKAFLGYADKMNKASMNLFTFKIFCIVRVTIEVNITITVIEMQRQQELRW